MRISDWSSDVCSSDLGQSLQQFSTPLPLAFVAAHAASIHAGDRVLEPSAGTGMLAIHAELAGAALALNELVGGRAELLERLFPAVPVTRHDGASIRSEEHTSELQSLMRTSYAVFCLNK